MGRSIVAVVAGIVTAFVTVLRVQALGTLVASAGVAPSLEDAERMRA